MVLRLRRAGERPAAAARAVKRRRVWVGIAGYSSAVTTKG